MMLYNLVRTLSGMDMIEPEAAPVAAPRVYAIPAARMSTDETNNILFGLPTEVGSGIASMLDTKDIVSLDRAISAKRFRSHWRRILGHGSFVTEGFIPRTKERALDYLHWLSVKGVRARQLKIIDTAEYPGPGEETEYMMHAEVCTSLRFCAVERLSIAVRSGEGCGPESFLWHSQYRTGKPKYLDICSTGDRPLDIICMSEAFFSEMLYGAWGATLMHITIHVNIHILRAFDRSHVDPTLLSLAAMSRTALSHAGGIGLQQQLALRTPSRGGSSSQDATADGNVDATDAPDPFLPNLLTLDVYATFSQQDIVLDIIKNSPRLEHLSVGSSKSVTDATVIALANHCPAFKSLDINSVHSLSFMSVWRLLRTRGSTITALNLSCTNNVVCDSNIIAIGECCPALIELKLSRSTFISVECLMLVAQRCVHLQTLCLNSCMTTTDELLKLLAANCHGLQVLELSGCCNVGDPGLIAIAHSASAAMLSCLVIRYCKRVTDYSMSEIAKKCNALRMLDCSSCIYVTHRSLDMVRKNCKHLESLMLTGSAAHYDPWTITVARGMEGLLVRERDRPG